MTELPLTPPAEDDDEDAAISGAKWSTQNTKNVQKESKCSQSSANAKYISMLASPFYVNGELLQRRLTTKHPQISQKQAINNHQLYYDTTMSFCDSIS